MMRKALAVKMAIAIGHLLLPPHNGSCRPTVVKWDGVTATIVAEAEAEAQNLTSQNACAWRGCLDSA